MFIERTYNLCAVLEGNLEAGRGERVAIECGAERHTYADVARLANRFGNGLRGLGVERENRVLLVLLDGVEFAAAFFGAAKIGAIPVPLNPMLPPAEYEYFLRDSRAKVAVVSGAVAHLVEPFRRQGPELKEVIVTGEEPVAGAVGWRAWIQGNAPDLEAAATSADEPGFWLYSSGSTGRPKAVVHRHQSVPFTCRRYASEVLGLGPEDVCFSSAKMFHAYGLGNSLTFPFSAGARVVLLPGPPLPETLVEVITRCAPTFFFSTPAGYVGMLRVPEGERRYDLRSVRRCVSAGEALPAEVFDQWKLRFGLEILDGIGSTEMLHIFISNYPGRARGGSSGQLVPGYQALIADEAGRPLGAGEVGDLLVSGDSAGLFYWNQREKTRQVMRGEWLFTGDKYRMDDEGYYWFQGRSDDMLKINGLWVSPVELEGLFVEHPAVAEAAVVGIKDGFGLTQVKAYLVLKPGHEPSVDLTRGLQKFARERAPQKYPRVIEFVDQLPRTATGKVRRAELRAAAERGVS